MSQYDETRLTKEQEHALLELLREYESTLKSLHEKAVNKDYTELDEQQRPPHPERPSNRPR